LGAIKQIFDPIVGTIAIVVVYVVPRPFAVCVQPCKPVCSVALIVYGDVHIAFAVAASHAADAAASAGHFPGE
jgi:hypothetical protein